VFADSRLYILHTGAIPAGHTCLLTSMDSALWAPPTSQTTKSYVLCVCFFFHPLLIPTSVTARMLTWINGVHAMHTRVLALTLQKYVQKDGHLPWALASAACWSASPTCRVRRGSWALSPK
jgi:hypothetical protein